MAVKVGDTVIYKQPEDQVPWYGVHEHPAIVTKVWSSDVLDVTVLPHGGTHIIPVQSLERGCMSTDRDCWWERGDE